MLPFWIYPSHWFLSGKEREIEYAKFKYNGQYLDIVLNKINNQEGTYDYIVESSNIKLKYNNISEPAYKKELVDIDYKFNKINKDERYKKILKIDLDYELISEEDYEFELFKIDNKKYDETDFHYQKKLLEFKLKWNKISKKDYDYNYNNLQNEVDSIEWKLQKNELDFLYGEINNFQYEKEKCTLHGIPYFEVTKGKYIVDDTGNEDSAGQIEFTFEYNNIFVEGLKRNQWPGVNEQEIIENYFKEVCRQIADEEEIYNEITTSGGYNSPSDYN